MAEDDLTVLVEYCGMVPEHASSRYEYATQALDALAQSFERDDALWFDNAYSDDVPVVPKRTLL